MTSPVYRRTVIQFLMFVAFGLFTVLTFSQQASASEIPISQGKSAVASSVTGVTYSAQ
ncbi:hypothetical protein [Paenibacillus sp. N3.4]|uniref:hypothetical protein n=1 Tax=Paenibacillus sp. N3.4 TaxID=2603222 RepID=UPI001C9CEBD8|nr:hypothetical protein [Paenibacillus sp. N3.4]